MHPRAATNDLKQHTEHFEAFFDNLQLSTTTFVSQQLADPTSLPWKAVHTVTLDTMDDTIGDPAQLPRLVVRNLLPLLARFASALEVLKISSPCDCVQTVGDSFLLPQLPRLRLLDLHKMIYHCNRAPTVLTGLGAIIAASPRIETLGLGLCDPEAARMLVEQHGHRFRYIAVNLMGTSLNLIEDPASFGWSEGVMEKLASKLRRLSLSQPAEMGFISGRWRMPMLVTLSVSSHRDLDLPINQLSVLVGNAQCYPNLRHLLLWSYNANTFADPPSPPSEIIMSKMSTTMIPVCEKRGISLYATIGTFSQQLK